MPLSRRMGRFLGPWLAFAILNGLGSALVCGLVVSVLGLIIGAHALAVATAYGALFVALESIGHNFPYFALIVLIGATYGLGAGIFTGAVGALVGRGIGQFWSFLACYGTFCVISSYTADPVSRGSNIFDPTVLFVATVVGATFPEGVLGWVAGKWGWTLPWQNWLRQWWLESPPYAARTAGILLPIVFCLGMDSYFIWPIFQSNQNYAARIGTWATWQNSRRFANPGKYGRGYNCQSNLRQIMLGVLQYQEDYEGYYPPKPRTANDGSGAVLQPYLKSTLLFQCPMEFYRDDNGNFSSGDFTDYWFNARLFGLNERKLVNTALTATWGDGNTGAGEANAAYSLSNIPTNFPPDSRHLGRANYAFADGHVKWMASGVLSNTAPSSGVFYTMNP